MSALDARATRGSECSFQAPLFSSKPKPVNFSKSASSLLWSSWLSVSSARAVAVALTGPVTELSRICANMSRKRLNTITSSAEDAEPSGFKARFEVSCAIPLPTAECGGARSGAAVQALAVQSRPDWPTRPAADACSIRLERRCSHLRAIAASLFCFRAARSSSRVLKVAASLCSSSANKLPNESPALALDACRLRAGDNTSSSSLSTALPWPCGSSKYSSRGA
mmetsp:Transcript_49479/g.143519  ORF Transcript_49479/g.143519 Transcript_49479/m.143519 type:complete len:224 (+) Transcript_49479:237-908(+)